MEKINKISNSKYEIEIKLTKKQVEPYLEKALKEDMKKVKEPGFRAGKVPKNVFIKKYGIESVYPTAIDLILNDLYPKLITENKLEVVAQPEFDWANVKISQDDGFSVKGTVDVAPEIELIDFEKVKSTIKKPEAKVTKKEIKDEIDNMLAADAKYETKDDYAATNGDITVIDFEGFLNGEPFEGGKAENHSLTLGSNSFIPGFEDQLIGTKKDDKKDVVVTFPKDYQAENLAGQEVTFKCEVKEVKKRTLPRLTAKKIEEFEGYDAKTKEELETQIEEKLLKTKEDMINFDYEKDVLEKIIKEMKLEVPQSMVDQETDHAIKNLEANFKQQGFGLDMYLQMTGMDMDTLKMQMNTESKDRIAKHLIIEKYLKENDIKITKKAIDDRLKKIMKDYNLSEEEVLKQIGEDKEPIKRDLQYEKVNNQIFK